MRIRRRPFLMLELLIAMAILALVLIPLLSPHFHIVKRERETLRAVELDRLANQAYGKILKGLYRGTVSPQLVVNGDCGELDLPGYKGEYCFSTEREKRGFGLYKCTLTFRRTEKTWNYDYFFVLERPVAEGDDDDDEGEDDEGEEGADPDRGGIDNPDGNSGGSDEET